MRFIYLVIVSFLFFGCASKPELTLNQQPIEVTNENISEYWIQKNNTFSFNLPLSRAPRKSVEGYVKLRFLIDSNGNTFNAEIIESVPDGFWDYAAVLALSKQEFVPAESNSSNIPVYYTQEIFFK